MNGLSGRARKIFRWGFWGYKKEKRWSFCVRENVGKRTFSGKGKGLLELKKLALLTLGFLLCYSEITFGVLPGTVLGC